jgi:drug/metabolite transporter (DMT)-like permease|tara:strand:- start:132 stop:1055 length:924 start_codon:yes stop_codon:yes gene_type:complete
MKSLTKKIYLLDFLLALVGYILFVVMDTIVKKLGDTYHVSQIILVNSLSALLPIFIFIQIRHRWRRIKTANLKIHFIRSVLMFGAMFSFIISVNHLSLVAIYSIVFVMPLLLTMGANFFLNEKVGWRRYTAIIIGFIGVIVSVDPFHESFNKYAYLALLVPVLVSINWLIIKKYGEKENTYSFLIYGKLFLIIFSGIFALKYFVPMTTGDFLLNFNAGLVRGIGMIFILNSARHLPSSLFAPTHYIQIFAGALIGYLVFGDIPTLNNYLGNILIIGAGIYIIIRELTLSKKIVTNSTRPIIIPIKKE